MVAWIMIGLNNDKALFSSIGISLIPNKAFNPTLKFSLLLLNECRILVTLWF